MYCIWQRAHSSTLCVVYSSDLVWIPWGDQATEFEGENEIRPVHDDILLLKLRPGQEIECECFAQKGQGRKHAKFSPVGTVTYKMFPRITFKKPVSFVIIILVEWVRVLQTHSD